jgi:NDP-sugar pyrophosphorylase family protein
VKVVVLAGGYRTRLRPLTYTRPKPMLPLARKPILECIIESIASEGFSDVIVSTNYFREQIIDYFGKAQNSESDWSILMKRNLWEPRAP